MRLGRGIGPFQGKGLFPYPAASASSYLGAAVALVFFSKVRFNFQGECDFLAFGEVPPCLGGTTGGTNPPPEWPFSAPEAPWRGFPARIMVRVVLRVGCCIQARKMRF